MASQDRDDANLKQFKSRTGNAKMSDALAPVPIQINVTFDGFDTRNEQIDTCAWTHVGTSPRVTPWDVARARHRMQAYMNDS